jgi:hypothetical protein
VGGDYSPVVDNYSVAGGDYAPVVDDYDAVVGCRSSVVDDYNITRGDYNPPVASFLSPFNLNQKVL